MRVILASEDMPQGECLIAGSLTQAQAEIMAAWLNEDIHLRPDQIHVVVPEGHEAKAKAIDSP
jgi:hypothetical protein